MTCRGLHASPGQASAPSNDGALLTALRQGQAGAFEQLMRRYNRLLFRAARGVVHDDAEAQDVVQEAWIKAFTGLRDFRGEASLATWLTRIAVHQALTQQRRLGRLVFRDEDPGEGDMRTTRQGPTERLRPNRRSSASSCGGGSKPPSTCCRPCTAPSSCCAPWRA